MTPMMTTYRVDLPDGTQLDAVTLEAARVIIDEHPGAECHPVVRYRPCPAHRGYEQGNCPACPSQAP